MDTPVQLIELPPKSGCYSTYKSSLHIDYEDREGMGPGDHPGTCYIRPADSTQRLAIHLYHGRFDPAQDMEDWGFEGPAFTCIAVAHDPDRVLFDGCDPQSLALAQRLGLATHGDTIAVDYHDDMLLVPQFRDTQPAYFGDLSITPQ